MDKSATRRALGPGGARWPGALSGEAGSAAGSPEQRRSGASGASGPGSGAVVEEEPAAGFSNHGTSRETGGFAPEIFSLQKTSEGKSGADV